MTIGTSETPSLSDYGRRRLKGSSVVAFIAIVLGALLLFQGALVAELGRTTGPAPSPQPMAAAQCQPASRC
jgi:hypothetical protein